MSYPLKLDPDHPDTVWMTKEDRLKLGVFPNIVILNKTLRKAAMVVVHSSSGERITINVGSIKYLTLLSTNNYSVINIYTYYGSNALDADQEAFQREAFLKAKYQITLGRLKEKLEQAEPRKGKYDDYYLLEADTFEPVDRKTRKRNGIGFTDDDNVVPFRPPPVSDAYIYDRIDQIMQNHDKILRYTMDFKHAVSEEHDILETKIRQLIKSSRQLVDEIKAATEEDDGHQSEPQQV